MFFKLRLNVPVIRFFPRAGNWLVLLFSVLLAASTSSSYTTQFWSEENPYNLSVTLDVSDPPARLETEDILEPSFDLCTATEQSCDSDLKMSNITTEQKQILKTLYREGGRGIQAELHTKFLEKSLELNIIPKAFKIKNNLPGNKNKNQKQLESVSWQSIKQEKEHFLNVVKSTKKKFEKAKDDLKVLVNVEAFESDMKRLEKHLKFVRKKRVEKNEKKLIRDLNYDDTTEDIVVEEGAQLNTVRVKRKRKFKRKYLQPQPKRKRRRNRNGNASQILSETLPEGWNGLVKNVSGEPLSEAEYKLLSRGKKFCPVERDPPIMRMQHELNQFYRLLRIKWFFQGQSDSQSELEKKFYKTSDWEPPKACNEIENFVKSIQKRFDEWKPPRRIKDNLTQEERKVLKDMNINSEVVYMWEDKGPSFTKMTKKQYLEAGDTELNNNGFYEKVDDDPTEVIKRECNDLVQDMQANDEISEKIAEFLLDGEVKLPKFYHVLKTHKLPSEIEDPSSWLENEGYPIRGIISGRGGPTERLAGFVEHFLQAGMRDLPTFMKDTKHALQIIEDINEQIRNGVT